MISKNKKGEDFFSPFFYHKYNMGCNCNKDNSIPLSIRKERRKKLKEKIADVKQLWKDSKTSETSGSITVSKDELGFK